MNKTKTKWVQGDSGLKTQALETNQTKTIPKKYQGKLNHIANQKSI